LKNIMKIDRMKSKTLHFDERAFGLPDPGTADSHADGNTKTLRFLAGLLPGIIDGALTPLQRRYIKMYYFKGMSYGEIAGRENVNKTTVYRHVARARGRIEKSLRYVVELRGSEE